MPITASAQKTLTVSQLNRQVKGLLEMHFSLIWVEGEISNISRPSSGHWYFTLKDATAQVSCAMFRGSNQRIRFTPNQGDKLRLRARVSLYENRGDYQLIVEHMEQIGSGALLQRFEALKEKLRQEGLFDTDTKKALPQQIEHLAVITSPSGAAIRDVLSVLNRRYPNMEVSVVPSQVQGDMAAPQLAKAIALADSDERFDAILLCRGGGSIEDLWAFNDEQLAYAIYQCKTPLVSAVGHEVDYTIADFVADIRAPTPSAAAELMSPDQGELIDRLHTLSQRLRQRIGAQFERRYEKLASLQARLRHPQEQLNQWHQRLDQLEIRLYRSALSIVQRQRLQHQALDGRLQQASPRLGIALRKEKVQGLNRQLTRNVGLTIANKTQAYHQAVAKLDIVSPIATLGRGYSITRTEDKQIIHSIDTVEAGQVISTTLNDGELVSTVTTKQRS